MKSNLSGPLILIVWFGLLIMDSVGAPPPENTRLPDLDRRVGGAAVAAAGERLASTMELQAQVAGARVDFDEVLGTPKWIRSPEGYLSGPGGVGKGISAGAAAGFAANDPYRTIKAFIQEHQALFGYGPDVLSTARVYREYITSHSGMQTTLWQQELDGIEVFEGVFAAHTTKDGELIGISSQFITDPSVAADAGASVPATRSQPVITAQQAAVNAAGSLREQVGLADLKPLGSVPTSQDQPQQFTAKPFDQAIEARLVWLPMNPSLMRLCWEVTMASRARGETFRLLVDAQTGEVQVRRCLTVYLSAATYRVYTSDSPSPFSPGWSAPNTAQPALTSRALVTWSALDTNASPNGWIDDGVNETRGNNVDAHTDINADNSPDLPRPQGSPLRVFDCPMDLTQSPATYTNAAVVQLFYWCNYMHDRLYGLGFTEAAGNFQNNNFGRGGLGNDAVQADAQDGSGFNNANFTPTSDGTAPRIQMYLFNGSTPYRDGDFDAEVVLHEYTHGLSERLVGGGVGISASQTGGMGEGWSDWYAMSVLSESGDDVNGCYASGGYVTYLLSGMTQNYYFGIRRYPYCTDLSKNPLTFKDIDPAQASSHAGIPRSSIIGTTANEVHNMGEVWCVTLWEARANLIARYGWAAGNLKMMQLATDGMKLGPANPNFLQARDGILQADLVDNGGVNRGELWAAFAKRGMGFTATSPASSTTTGLHESFDVPDDLQITPAVLSVSGPVGGPFSPNPVSFVLANTGSNTITWTLNSTSSWVTVSPASGTLAAGGPGVNVGVTVVPAATNFSLGAYTAAIQFTNQTSGQVQTRALSLFVVGRNLFDDFDPGIDLSQWSGFGGTVGSTVIATNYGGYISSPNSLWFGDAGSRFATTLPINTSNGGAISFYICLANGSVWPWEQVDLLPDEGVVLEASTNSGSTWTLLGSYDTTAYYTWTAVTLAIPTAAQAPATQFRWRQKSHSGSSFDHWALDNVTIDAGPTPPTVQSQPQDQTVLVGNTATFSLSVSGSSPLSYLWRRNGNLIPGANGSSYATNNVQLSDSGSQFSCWISNAFGIVTSRVATLTVVVMPPSIGTQPSDQMVTVGSSAVFSLNATGSTPLSYFWRRNGTPIAGANSFSYTTNNVQLADSGSQFSCLVSNAYGTILSSNATLFVTTVSTPVFLNGNFLYLPINTNGVFLAANTGGKFNSAGTGGSTGVDFWWPGTPIYNYVIGVGGIDYTNGSFQTITVNDLSSGGLKRALIDATIVSGLHFTRDISFADNSKAIKIVDTLQNIGSATLSSLVTLDSTDPDQDFPAGNYSTLNDVVSVNRPDDMVVATAPSTGLSLGFGSDSGTQIPSAVGFDNRDAYAYLTVVDPGGISSDIAINLAQNYGSLSPGQSRSVTWYMVFDVSKAAVTNAFASLGSTTNPPSITSQPVNQTVFTGGTATFGVAAIGTLPLGYQWNFNGTNLSGATNALLVLTNVQFNQAGSYAVRVTNAFGSMFSSNALLTVIPPSSCVPAPSNLVAWWPGEGSGNDIIGSNNATVIAGTVTYAAAEVGQGFSLDGGANRLVVPDSPVLDFGSNQDFSIEAWISPLPPPPTPSGGILSLVDKRYAPNSSQCQGYEFNLVNGQVHCRLSDSISNNGTEWGAAGPDLRDGNMHHVALTVVRNSATGGHMYVDGVPVLEFNPTGEPGDLGTAEPLRIGNHPDSAYSCFFKGRIDELALYRRALSSSEIAAIYNAGSSGKCLPAQAPVISSQPMNQTVLAGDTATFNVAAYGSLPLSYQWRFNGTNLNGATDSTLTLTNVQFSQAGNYAVLVTNLFGAVLSSNAVLTVAGGGLPDSFNPVADGEVRCTAVQADGKIVVGGYFTTLGGLSRNNIGRLNADGTVDTSFNPVTGANNSVYSLVVQADGKIVAGGDFTTLGGQSRSCIGRLNADGTLDSSFNPGADGTVYGLAVQADGRILVGGQFTALGGLSRLRIGRLNPDGTVDTGFNPGANGVVASLATQSDGKILVWGWFGTLGGQNRFTFGRLNADGTVDTGFNPAPNSNVTSVSAQADGKILVGGWFTSIGGQSRSNVARLNLDGTVDTSFNPGANNAVISLAIQTDGKTLAGGYFSMLGGQSRSCIGRLNADGTLDTGFNPGANGAVSSLAVQADGKSLVGGAFTMLGGQSRSYIGRLTPTAPATQSLICAGSTATWLRGGSSPEVWWTTFDGSTNGTNWAALGTGTRIAGGWQLAGLAPTNVFLRARGYVTGGDYNSSGWFVETILETTNSSPQITSPPANQTVVVGGTATFAVTATGTLPLNYQWNFNGANLSGATNSTLTLTNVQFSQAGNYAVLVTNLFGAVLSSNAVLTVNSGTALNVLLIWDINSGGTLALSNALAQAGIEVTLSATDETAYNGANPSPAGFGAVIHLNGTTYTADMPFAGQVALSNYVHSGGGYIQNEWDAFEYGSSHMANMRDLILFDRAGGWGGSLTLTNVPGQAGHPVLANVPSNFTFQASFNLGSAHVFSTDPVTVLMRNDTNDAVAVRQFGLGRIVGFHHAGNYESASGFNTLSDPNVQQLYINGVRWAARSLGTNQGPIIVTQPANQTVPAGGTATFSVTASGTPPLSYQWLCNGANLSGATNSALSLTNVQFSQTGNYAVLVTNLYGSALSSNALLTVIAPPVITTQPANQTVAVGNTATFSLIAAGTEPLGYSWRRNGAVIPGATGNSYSLTNAQLTDSGGKFSCLITNAWGAALSSNAVLKVIETVIPNDLCSGAIPVPAAPYTVIYTNAQSTAYATSTGDPVPDCIPDFGNGVWYQFTPPNSGLLTVDTFGSDFDTGLAVYTGTCGSLTEAACNDDTDGMTSQIILPVNGGTTYFILAGGYSAYVGNLVLHLSYATPPMILAPPASQEVIVNSNATFTVAAGGSQPLSYQWFFNGVALTDSARISGATTSSLNLSNVLTSDTGDYSVAVSNLLGSASSLAAHLTIVVPPVITTQPVGRSVVLGQPVTLSATASGSPLLSYQWQLNGTNVMGATNNTYAISAAGLNDFGTYHLVVSNRAGVAVSANALVTWGQIVTWGRSDYGLSNVPPGLSNVVMVAGGGISGAPGDNTVALCADGTVVSWGFNGFGQTNVPPNATNVVAVAAGGAHCLALRANGTVVGWGYNSFGQSTVPSTLSNVVAIAAGGLHSLALRADGKVVAWGMPAYGQTSVPTNLVKVVAIGAGAYHSLAVCADGTVVAWGQGFNGQTNVPLNATNVIAVAGGFYTSLALRANGTVLSWGTNNTAPGLTNAIPGLTNATGIGSGDNYYLALRANGTVLAWGYNNYAQTNVPAYVSNAVAVASGASHGLALISNGRPMITRPPVGGTTWVGREATFSAAVAGAQPLSCQWQFNGADIPGATNLALSLSNLALTNTGNYQITVSNALGTITSVPAPLTVLSNSTLSFWSLPVSQTNYQGNKIMTAVSVLGNGPLSYQWYFSVTNTGYGTIAGATNDTLTLDPALAVQSGNYYVAVSNQLNIAKQSGGITSPPVRIQAQFARAWGFLAVSNPPVNVTNAVAIATGGTANSGSGHYLALSADGKLTSWANYYPGFGETNVSALSNSFVTAIAASYQHSLALLSDGTISAWGYGYYGQTNPPSGLNGVVAIACADYHDLALRSDGTIVAWGQNIYGEGTNSPAATNAAVAIAAGMYHNLGLRPDGTVFGWGYNSYGQTLIPIAASNVIAIAAGQYHSLALRANGTVVGWGYNSYGQITIPAGLSNVVAISASGSHSTLLRADGTVVALGYEYGGFASNMVPADLINVIAITSGGEHDFALLGTRAPYFTIQPLSRTVYKGTNNILLAGKVVGVQPVTYQWRLNGTNLPGATNDTFIVGQTVGPSKTNLPVVPGSYQLVASNAYGVTLSKPAKLVVTIPLGEALDTTNRIWTTSGNSLWFGQTNVTHDGVDAARSGDIGNNQETILQTVLATNGPGRCIFWWKVSSEDYFDVLEFRVNGVTQAAISGEVDWQSNSIPIPTGTNTLQWRYSKDISYGSGQDAGWVDQFSFVLDPPVIVLQPVSRTANMGDTVQFTVGVTGAQPMFYQWWHNGTNNAGVGGVLTLTGVGRTRNGTYAVTVSNTGGSTLSSNAVLKVLVPQKLGAPVLLPDGTFQLTAGDADGGLLAASDLANFEALASSNLVDWVPLTNALSLTNGMLRVQDNSATNRPQRFYRLIENP